MPARCGAVMLRGWARAIHFLHSTALKSLIYLSVLTTTDLNLLKRTEIQVFKALLHRLTGNRHDEEGKRDIRWFLKI